MEKTLKIVGIIMIIAILIGMANISNAFSFNASLSSDDKLVAGQEVKVTLSLSNIDMDDGIRSIKVGKITVGEEFEAIATTSFSSSIWMPTYSNGGLILMSGTPITNAGSAVILTLKVKPGITAKSSTITFENIVASSGSNTGDITVGTKTITIKANETTGSGNDTGTTNTPTKNNTTNNLQGGANKAVSNSTTKEVTSSKAVPNKLPKTGYTQGIVILTLILIAIVVGIVSFVKYKK